MNRVGEIAATEHIKGCKCEVERTSFRVAMEYNERNAQLLSRMNEIFKSVGLVTLKAPLETAARMLLMLPLPVYPVSIL